MAEDFGIGSALDPNQGAQIDGVEPDTTVRTENTENPQELGGAGDPSSTLTYISFPNDIENLEIPYTLFKIFEIRRVEGSDRPDSSATEGPANVGAREAVQVVDDVVTVIPAGERVVPAIAGGIAAGSAGALAGAFQPEITGAAESALDIPQGSLASRAKEALSNFSLKRNVEQLQYALALPMPENLASQYSHNYEELSLTQSLGNLGIIGQALAAKKGNLLGGGGLDPYIMEAGSNILGALPGVTNLNKGLFFGTTGLAINPQLEMLYSNPQLRQFQFDFVLTAKNSLDSAMIKTIINQLKYYSHPEVPQGTTGRYYIPPSQFEIEFYSYARDTNIFLFKTKKCVLRDLTVDYTSPGTFASFSDGSPVQVRLSLQFQEVSILTRADIASGVY